MLTAIKKYVCLALLLGGLTCPALAVTPTPPTEQPLHPIEQGLNACLDQNASTSGMATCLDQAYRQWDAELNRVYLGVKAELEPPAQAALTASQRAWLVYRDAEFITQDAIYGALQGSMWGLSRLSTRVELVKHRALELQSYWTDLREGR